jgi:hypothetical protein
MSQVVQHMSSKHNALSSLPSIKKIQCKNSHHYIINTETYKFSVIEVNKFHKRELNMLRDRNVSQG